MPAEVNNNVALDRLYNPSHFEEGVVLTSDQLNLFQTKFSDSLDRIVQAVLKNVTWVVIDSKKDVTASKLWLDAIFTEDVSGSDPNDSTFYSHGHGARSAASTPNFPEYFTFGSGDRIYFGDKLPFRQLDIDLETVASATVSPTFEFWNGSTWTSFVGGFFDGTSGLTVNGDWVFTVENTWGYDDLDTILGLTDFSIDTRKRFWIRMTAGATSVTKPKIEKVTRDFPFESALLVLPTAGTPDLNVGVEPGVASVADKIVVVPERQVLDLSGSVPGSDSRIVTVQLSSDGTIGIKNGDIAASPIAPEPDGNAIKLADVTLPTGTTQIFIGNIMDSRIEYSKNFSWA